MGRSSAWLRTFLAFCHCLALAGCGATYAPLPPGSIAGRLRLYDYSPAAIQSGDTEQIWYCGADVNPTDTTQLSDAIVFESLNRKTGAHQGPFAVLAETQGAWDSNFLCNPKVIRGVFSNPLGDGATFTYALYYVAIGATANNFIGVAFSNDGRSWRKYPHPILSPPTSQGYGVAQPAPYNMDQHSSIRLFYENDLPDQHHLEAVSSDGVHFTLVGTLTKNGLDPVSPTWGDMAYDPQTHDWYALYNSPFRDPSTTGGITERGQYGFKIYRIADSSLLNGATPWEELFTVDTNLTGYEANFIPGFVRDMYGNVSAASGITMVTSISNPPAPWNATPDVAGGSGDIGFWDIGQYTWKPGQPLVPFVRYANQATHEVTTGWLDPKGGFSQQQTLGQLYRAPQGGATRALYGCKSGATDYFVSLEPACEGGLILGLEGYAFPSPIPGMNLTALYRCKTSTDHFVSTDANCEGQTTQLMLGYVLP
jgi:hypothetical protein